MLAGHTGTLEVGRRRGDGCPLWVISGHDVIKSRCPLYPQKRTFIMTIQKRACTRAKVFPNSTFFTMASRRSQERHWWVFTDRREALPNGPSKALQVI